MDSTNSTASPVERQRYRGGFTDPVLTYTGFNVGCVPVTNYTVTKMVGVGKTESMMDSIVPDFKKRRSNGEVFFNRMNSLVREQTLSEAFTNFAWTGKADCGCGTGVKLSYSQYGNFAGNLANYTYGVTNASPLLKGFSDSDIGRAIKEASTAAVANIGNTESNSDMFQTLAELKQLSSLVRDPMRQVSILLGKFESKVYKMSRTSNPIERAEAAAKLWVTYRLAVRPLLVDIETIVEKMGTVSQGYVRRTSRGFSTLDNSFEDTKTRTNSLFTQTCKLSGRDTLSVRAMSLDEHTIHWGEHYGLTATNLASLPYNLITLSFVADWFANIGDVLASMTPLPGYKHLGGCVVVRRETVNLFTEATTVVHDTTSNWASTGSGTFTVRETSVLRLPVLPTGLVTRASFGFDKLSRLTDAASLAFIMRGRVIALGSGKLQPWDRKYFK